MKSFLVILALLGISLTLRQLQAVELELSMRPHAGRVLFGDPVFFEITVRNRGAQNVKAHPETVHGDRFRFEIRDKETDLITRRPDADGQPSPRSFESDTSKRFHQWLFLPSLHQMNHTFWKPARHGRTLYVSGVYSITPGVELRSDWHAIEVTPRDENQLKTLETWINAEIPGYDKGPSINDFGTLFVRSNLNRQQTAEVARSVTSGELSDLLLLSIQMQDIYSVPPDSRQARERGLVEWLKKQPDIKREALVKKVTDLARSYDLTSTVKALMAIGVDP